MTRVSDGGFCQIGSQSFSSNSSKNLPNLTHLHYRIKPLQLARSSDFSKVTLIFLSYTAPTLTWCPSYAEQPDRMLDSKPPQEIGSTTEKYKRVQLALVTDVAEEWPTGPDRDGDRSSIPRVRMVETSSRTSVVVSEAWIIRVTALPHSQLYCSIVLT